MIGDLNLAAGRTFTPQNNAQINLGSSTTLSGGTIGPGHYDQWRAHFGQTNGGGARGSVSSSNVSSNIPEPTSLLLPRMGCIATGIVRRNCRLS